MSNESHDRHASDLPTDPSSRGAELPRRAFLGGALGASAAAFAACHASGSIGLGTAKRAPATSAASDVPAARPVTTRGARTGYPVLVGSNNALAGMKTAYPKLLEGADPLDAVIEVVKVAEADPKDDSVGLGGLPNEEGVVQLDAACMYGPRHKSGAVACLENILHPSEVARLVLERTDHVLLVGHDAYRFARAYGHAHVDLLTEESRRAWLEWKENTSKEDDRLPPPPKLPWSGLQETSAPRGAWIPPADDSPRVPRDAAAARRAAWLRQRLTGTIHCSGLARDGAIACTTTTSGLSWKIPGRVGDSPLIGCGLYCDQEAGSAGATGRGEANILANGGFAIVELMRQGATPRDAAYEVLRRVTRQTQRQARYQPDLVDEKGLPSFNLIYYVLGLDGSIAGVALRQPKDGDRATFAASTPEKGPHLVPVEALHLG